MRRKQIRPQAHFHREAEGNGGGRPGMSGTSHGAGRVKPWETLPTTCISVETTRPAQTKTAQNNNEFINRTETQANSQ